MLKTGKANMDRKNSTGLSDVTDENSISDDEDNIYSFSKTVRTRFEV